MKWKHTPPATLQLSPVGSDPCLSLVISAMPLHTIWSSNVASSSEENKGSCQCQGCTAIHAPMGLRFQVSVCDHNDHNNNDHSNHHQGNPQRAPHFQPRGLKIIGKPSNVLTRCCLTGDVYCR